MSVSTTYQPSAATARTGQGSAIANREDLDSKLTMLDAGQYPLTMLCKRGARPKSALFEWPIDEYDDPNTDGVVEGQDLTTFDDKFEAVAVLNGRVQRFLRSWRVTKEQEMAESAGNQNSIRAKAKAMTELKRDFEKALASDNDSVAGVAGTAAKMRGLDTWIASAGPSDVPAQYRTPAASIITALTEITLNDVLRSMHDQKNGVANVTMVNGSRVQQEVAEFTRTDNNASEAVYHVHQAAESKKVTLSVKVFDSDFGLVKMVNANSKCQSTLKGFLLDPNFLELRYQQEPGGVELPDLGGGPRGYVDMFASLAMRDPRSAGKVTLAA
jgi:hypothetical protein